LRRHGLRSGEYDLGAALESARERTGPITVDEINEALESWRELTDGRIEFIMRRLPSAD
jgi:hypothetical protein